MNKKLQSVNTEKKRMHQKLWFKLIGILVVISIVNGTFLTPSYSVIIPKYMKDKYNEEFVYKGILNSNVSIVSPVRFPDMMIYVRPMGNLPTQWKFRDNYYGQLTSRIIEQRIRAVLSTGLDADEWFLNVESNLSMTDEILKLESKYSIDEIASVIDNSPELVMPCGVQLHVYSKREDISDIIRILHEAFETYGLSERVKNSYLIADTLLVEKNEKINNFYLDNDFYAAKNQVTDDYMKWEFFNKFGISNEQACKDYNYFKNAVMDIREEWSEKDKERYND